MINILPFQFVISDASLNASFAEGCTFSHKGFHITIHRDNLNNLVCTDNCIFFGEVFDFENSHHSNNDIVKSFIHLSLEERIEKINRLSGFFVFMFLDTGPVIFNDCAGQLEVFIYKVNNRLVIGSVPELLFTAAGQSCQFDENSPAYIRENHINIFNKTPFAGVAKLIPNFYYNVSENKMARFFPVRPIISRKTTEVAQITSVVIEKIMESISHRKFLAITLTAGWDSRVLFGASLRLKGNIRYFLFRYETKDSRSDCKIAGRIAKLFARELKVIDYRAAYSSLKNQIAVSGDQRLIEIARLFRSFFPDCFIVNGNISEVARNFYEPLPKNLSDADICYLIGAQEGPYEKEAVARWRATTTANIRLLDSIYWEHKMPNWAGRAKSLYNQYTTVISPFNNRYLLSLLLSAPLYDRDKYFNKLYQNILLCYDKRLTKIPINPTLKHKFIVIMKILGIYVLYRSLFFRMRKLSFA